MNALEVQFWAKVDKTESCWLWTGLTDPNGYGRFLHDGTYTYAHRWAFAQFNGPIPEGMHLDHLCRVRNCVRPEHLDVVTPGENVLRGEGLSAQNARKTHCKQGHAFDYENTYIDITRGTRHCRECRRVSRRKSEYKSYWAKKGQANG